MLGTSTKYIVGQLSLVRMTMKQKACSQVLRSVYSHEHHRGTPQHACCGKQIARRARHPIPRRQRMQLDDWRRARDVPNEERRDICKVYGTIEARDGSDSHSRYSWLSA